MSADWIAMSKRSGLVVDGHAIDVELQNERRHRVFIDAARPDLLRLWAVVAPPSVVAALPDAHMRAWARNRLSELVGFRLDGRRRMIGEAWLPTEGLSADDWGFVVRYIARVCDGFEQLLTGKDDH